MKVVDHATNMLDIENVRHSLIGDEEVRDCTSYDKRFSPRELAVLPDCTLVHGGDIYESLEGLWVRR